MKPPCRLGHWNVFSFFLRFTLAFIRLVLNWSIVFCFLSLPPYSYPPPPTVVGSTRSCCWLLSIEIPIHSPSQRPRRHRVEQQNSKRINRNFVKKKNRVLLLRQKRRETVATSRWPTTRAYSRNIILLNEWSHPPSGCDRSLYKGDVYFFF